MSNIYNTQKDKFASFIKILMLIIFSFLQVRAYTQVSTWLGGGTGWLTVANWNPTGAPSGTGAEAYFNNNTNLFSGINMSGISAGNSSIGCIHYGTGATSTRTLRNSSATPGVLTLNGLTINTVNNTILNNESTGTHIITNNATDILGIGLGNTTENVIVIEGGGGVDIGSVISGTARNLTKDGLGSGYLNLTGVNTYTGATNLKAGYLSVSTIANGSLPSSIGASTSAATNLLLGTGYFRYTGATTTTNRNFTLTTGQSPWIDILNAATTLTITGGSAATNGELTKWGLGTLELAGTNLHTGNTNVYTGTLQLNKTGGNTLLTTNNIFVSNGTLRISTNQTVNNISINGGSIIVDPGVTLTVNGTFLINGVCTVSGTIVYGANGELLYTNNITRTVGAEWPNANEPKQVFILDGSNISLAQNETILADIYINTLAKLIGTGFTLTVGGSWYASTGGDYTGGINSASTVLFNGTGTHFFYHDGGATFRNLRFVGTGSYEIHDNINISVNTLTISNGIVDMLTNTLNGSGNLTMTGGILKQAKLSTTLPELGGIYAITGGTIELNGLGNQQLKGGENYANLTFSENGTKTLSSAINPPTNTIIGTITVANTAILDVANRTMGGALTNLTMTNTSRYRTAGTGTKPDAQGVYTLGAATTIEFTNTTATQQDIRLSPSYNNIEVSGTNVGNASLVTGILVGSDFTVKTGATFNLANTAGFTGSTATAVSNLNSPSITLESNSTINYNGAAQTITNTLGYQNLRFSGTGIKTAPTTNLLINGNLSRAGSHTFNANAGRVVFQGTTPQTYSAALGTLPIDFYNLSSINPQNLIVDSTFGISNELNLTSTAKLNLNIGDIIMRSSANRTAYITDLGTTAASINITYGTGRFSIERFLFAQKSWRFLATPVVRFQFDASSPTITNSWREGTLGVAAPITSNGYGTRLTGPTGMDEYTQRSSMKSYNMVGNNFVEINNTKLNDTIANDAGYFVFVRGDRGVAVPDAAGTTTLRIKGKIRTGDQTFSVNANSFQSFGNPYASAIDFRSVTKNIVDAFIVWNPAIAGSYNVGGYENYVYDGVAHYKKVPGGQIRDSIQSGEAVFIQSTSNGSVVVKEADKVNGSRLVSRLAVAERLGVTKPTLEINLYTKNIDGSNLLADGVLLNFDNSFSNVVDNLDVRKVNNTYDNLTIKTNAKNLVVERRMLPTVADTIFLNLSNTRVANYWFEIDPSVLSNTGLEAFLKDKFLQTETAISFSDVTNLNFDITADAASRATDRFMIVFKQALPTPTFIAINAFTNANKTNEIRWKINNENKVASYTLERSTNGIDFTAIKNTVALQNNNTTVAYSDVDARPLESENYYRIKMVLLNANIMYSDVVKVAEINNDVAITISPNPVADKTIRILLYNQPSGMYNMRLVNNAGQVIYNGRLVVSSYLQTENIVLDKNTAAGNYQLIMVDASGQKTIKEVVIGE